MNKTILYEDLKNRANDIYHQYSHILNEFGKGDFIDSDWILKFNLLENNSINGSSYYKNGIDYIEMNTGLIDIFYNYFYDFIENDLENYISNIMNSGMINTTDTIEILCEYGTLEDIKNDVASLLNIFVSRFILTHELGHLLNGHCRYCSDKDKHEFEFIPIFNFEICKNDSEIPPLDRCTLEFDADAFASTDNYRNLVILYNDFENKVDIKMKMNKIDLFYWWGFAIRSLFLLNEAILKDENYIEKNLYLPSVVRWHCVVGSILNIVDHNLCLMEEKDSKESLRKIIKGCKDAECYYNQTRFDFKNWLNQMKDNENYLNIIDNVKRNWEIITPKLDQYSRLPLYNKNNLK